MIERSDIVPIPVILGGIAAVTAAIGVKKGYDAKKNYGEARNVNESARWIAKVSEDSIKAARDNTKNAVEKLGLEKINILSSSITDFVVNFEKIKDINIIESEGINELKDLMLKDEGFKQLKEAAFHAKDLAVNGLAAVGAGTLVAYGTYSAIMGGYVGALASTGTAIGTLSGVAATNATLAWIGGGSLAAGGFGMAGGMVVLGGIVAGPAIAIGGVLMASQAQKALNEAYNNLEKAKVFETQAQSIVTALNAIIIRANGLTEVLQKLNSIFVSYVTEMKDIILNTGIDWNQYSEQEKENIFRTVKLAQVIKVILDTTLLNQNGELEKKAAVALETGNKYLQALNA